MSWEVQYSNFCHTWQSWHVHIIQFPIITIVFTQWLCCSINSAEQNACVYCVLWDLQTIVFQHQTQKCSKMQIITRKTNNVCVTKTISVFAEVVSETKQKAIKQSWDKYLVCFFDILYHWIPRPVWNSNKNSTPTTVSGFLF